MGKSWKEREARLRGVEKWFRSDRVVSSSTWGGCRRSLVAATVVGIGGVSDGQKGGNEKEDGSLIFHRFQFLGFQEIKAGSLGSFVLILVVYSKVLNKVF